MTKLSLPELVARADEIASQAKNGTFWSKDRYDHERFERIFALSTEIVASALDIDPEVVARGFTDDPGTITAKVGVSVAAFDAEERLLLIQRKDNSRWAMPGGIVEYGETLAHAATREALEESGIDVQIRAHLGIYDARRHGFQTIYHWQHISFLATVRGGTPGPSDETLAARLFTQAEIAGLPISPGHDDPIRDAFAAQRTPHWTVFFDP